MKKYLLLFLSIMASTGAIAKKTALHDAVFKMDLPKIAKLLKNGANPNEQDEFGATALHAMGDYIQDHWKDKKFPLESAKLLINAGANVGIKDAGGVNALENYLCATELWNRHLDPSIQKTRIFTPTDDDRKRLTHKVDQNLVQLLTPRNETAPSKRDVDEIIRKMTDAGMNSLREKRIKIATTEQILARTTSPEGKKRIEERLAKLRGSITQ